MNWIYSQSTGKFLDSTGRLLAIGYAGFGPGKNNPAMQDVSNVGPIPRGTYEIGPAHVSPVTGPISMCLIPVSGTNTFGRSAFLIHGDDIRSPGVASHGCIVLPREAREEIAASSDRTLQVVS